MSFRLLLKVVREVLKLDETVLADNRRVFDDVFQLANIARKVVRHHDRQDLGRDTLNFLPIEAIELPDKVVDQQGDVFSSIPQGWQEKSNHIDSVIEVLSEGARFHQIFQLSVAGRDNPYVRLFGLSGPEGLVDFVLQHTEETDL